MVDYSSYIKTYIKRAEIKEQKRKELFKDLNKQARQAAKALGEKFKLKKVYLFGSLTNFDSFQLSSDIDLAVEGLNSTDYFDAWGVLEDILDCSFDLVQMDKATNSLKKIIKREGVILFERAKEGG